MAKATQVVMLLAKAYLIDTRVRNEAESLHSCGYPVQVLSWDRDGRQPPSFEVDGVKVRSLKLLGGRSFSGLGYFISAMLLQTFAFFWCIRNYRGRMIVHANDFNTLLGGVMVRLALRGGVRLIYDCHELTPSVYAEWFGSLSLGFAMGILEKSLMRRADRVMTVSPGLAAYLERESGREVSVVFNTPRLSEIPKEGKEQWKQKLGLKGLVVSFVGYLRRDAALEELVSVAKKFEEGGREDVTFVVVGSGPDWDMLEQRSKGLENFRLIPNVPYWLALGYVRASDISMAVYRYTQREDDIHTPKHWLLGGSESLTMHWKVSEAMACETCVMLREGTTDWAFVRKYGVGISAGSGTVDAMFNSIDWVTKNAESARAIAKAGYMKFLADFKWESMANRLLRIYEP